MRICRLPDGTEGWVKAAYRRLTSKPAKLIVTEPDPGRTLTRLTAELEESRRAFAEPAAAIEALKSETETLESGQLDESRTLAGRIAGAERPLRAARKAQYKGSLPLTWVAGCDRAVPDSSAFIVGLWWVDHRSRKRHGGIRVY